MANLKFGVIGCGRIGKLHINNLLNNIDGAEVVAAADQMLDKSHVSGWQSAASPMHPPTTWTL